MCRTAASVAPARDGALSPAGGAMSAKSQVRVCAVLAATTKRDSETMQLQKSDVASSNGGDDDVALLPEARDAPPPGRQEAGFFSRVAFLWVGPLLKQGRLRQLQQTDLFEVRHAWALRVPARGRGVWQARRCCVLRLRSRGA